MHETLSMFLGHLDLSNITRQESFERLLTNSRRGWLTLSTRFTIPT